MRDVKFVLYFEIKMETDEEKKLFKKVALVTVGPTVGPTDQYTHRLIEKRGRT